MEDKNKPIDGELRSQISEILKRQIFLECQNDSLKAMFAGLLSKMVPKEGLIVADQTYRNLMIANFEKKMAFLKEHNQAYSDEITEQMRSELKDIPGIILPSL